MPAEARAPFSSISVDARTGKVISAVDPDGFRHPASLTKMMTLYVLFQDLKSGKVKLNSPIRISARAASMSPSKLGARPGTSITVDQAIRALVVISANDVAAGVAETLGGTEAAFAARMTKTARSIGMSRTTFYNASGLPNPNQWTTARDMATLGLRLQRDFPQYYPYFKTMSFTYAGRTVRTHNRLLGKFDGADGIKTGYVAASGFNLVSSAKRGQRRIVGTVMGGISGGARDAYMKRMLETAFPACVSGKTIAAMAGSTKGAIAVAEASTAPDDAGTQPSPDDSAALAQASDDASSMDEGDSGDDDATAAAPAPKTVKPSKAKVAVAKPAKSSAPAAPKVIEADVGAPALPAKLPFAVKPEASQADVDASLAALQPQDGAPAKPQTIASLATDSGWHVQIGSYQTKKEAADRLTRLRANGPSELRDKPAFTVTVQKGTETSYRARFSGFTEKEARSTCEELARKNMACYVVAPSS
ncbi:SPOR domain-containing protein [Aestuariivirga sp.]|uniref:SPOR domain-containing protein n=1 Tax=Aestuariivirga sp. TaxID=2650926 RepID=UPI0039E376C7